MDESKFDPPSTASDYLNQFDPILLDQQLRDLSRLLQIFHPLLTPVINSLQNSVSSQWTSNCSTVDSSSGESNQKDNDIVKGEHLKIFLIDLI